MLHFQSFLLDIEGWMKGEDPAFLANHEELTFDGKIAFEAGGRRALLEMFYKKLHEDFNFQSHPEIREIRGTTLVGLESLLSDVATTRENVKSEMLRLDKVFEVCASKIKELKDDLETYGLTAASGHPHRMRCSAPRGEEETDDSGGEEGDQDANEDESSVKHSGCELEVDYGHKESRKRKTADTTADDECYDAEAM